MFKVLIWNKNINILLDVTDYIQFLYNYCLYFNSWMLFIYLLNI